ncbi:MAG TPA: C4-type zinc ribbon domain-containing protein [Desulfovibrio sp.]|uniref:zinc ribbon domain-containing protein n=1 Tax=Desulfovibrio sp. TaxID=885 RepID=UPI002C03D5E0|nr:C4-type zinc ribbon domain-containing protein [Desulfovibrio sp.]HMM37983.1 C4-type zinc ribbon domain-containing protein [Desulfovibrio sp.]
MYQKQIEQLILLQAVDDEIIVLEAEIQQAPQELSDLEGRVASLKERQTQIDERLEVLRAQQKKLEFEIEEDAGKIKKSKNKLMMVGNTKEYHAMMREMDSLERVNRMREEEKIAIMEEIGRQEEGLKDLDKDAEGIREEYAAKKATLGERLDKARKRVDSLDKKRKKAGKVVPPPILGRYEFIRARISHPVIVPVALGVCSGCNIMIPPQIYNDLQKGKQIIACPNCQRLIYWQEHAPSGAPSVQDEEE